MTGPHAYDALGRLIGKIYPDRNQALFKYDAAGRLTSASNQHIGYVMSYDAAGRLTAITDSNQRTIRYQYDTMGNRVKMTTPEGKVVQYRYDEANRLMEITSFLGTFDLGYDTLGRRTSLAYPNGISTGYGYDAAGRLTGILAQAGGRKGRGEVINAFTYTHDAVGNRLSKAVSMNDHGHKDATYQYTYDAVYQLLQSLPNGHRGHNGQEAERYTYDPVGNRLTGPERKETYRYNTVNELVASRKTGYRYDYNGNMVARGEWSYEYDYENRLVKATKAEGDEIKTVSFKYDPFGRRIEKKVEEIEEGKVKGKTYTYVYDNEDIILEYRSGADEDDDGDRAKVKVSRFVHGPGIDEPLAIEQKGKVYYYHADGLGSIVSLTDNKGRVVESFDYSAFGFMQRQGGEVKQPYAYTGREWDKELGLYYYRARYYDPAIGRFISKDPIEFSGGDVNLYRYVQNNPVNWTDPSGLIPPFIIKQIFNRTAKCISKRYTRDIAPAGRRIIGAGIGGAAAGAVGGAIVGTPALGVGAVPSSVVGSIIGFSGGLLLQTGLETTGGGQYIEDLTNEIISNLKESTTDTPDSCKKSCE